MSDSEYKESNFVHLHLHTEHSTLDGINRLDKLPQHIKSIGQQAVAQTDHGVLTGSYSFFKKCNIEGIKPILGIESYYTVNDRTVREKDEHEKAYYHLVLLAKNNNGLKNLFKLSSRAFTEGFYYKPRIDDALLAEFNQDLYATSSCLGSKSSALIIRGETSQAEKLLSHHASIFKDRFFLELQLHENEEQQKVNQVLIGLSKKYNWPLIVTNDAHYMLESDKRLHELTLRMATGGDAEGFSFGDIDVHVASHDWIRERASKQNIPYEAITNTKHIADSIESHTYFSDRKNRYTKFRNLPKDESSWSHLEKLCWQSLQDKFDNSPPENYKERLNHELRKIKLLGFSDYMLIVREYIEVVKTADIWVGPARGSSCGSLTAYLLGITQVDPIKYGLLFERFLNEGRRSIPLILDQDMLASAEALRNKGPDIQLPQIIKKTSLHLGPNLLSCHLSSLEVC